MCEKMDDVFENLPTLDDLEDEMLEEDRITLAVSVVENLLEQIRLVKEELNDYHIRDAEMEGWMSIPRNRYLRLLGLELENRDLIRRIEYLERELEEYGEPDFIVQPPEDCEAEPLFEPAGETGFPGFGGIAGTGPQADPSAHRVYSHTPLMWRDTVALEEKDIEKVVEEVMRRFRRGE